MTLMLSPNGDNASGCGCDTSGCVYCIEYVIPGVDPADAILTGGFVSDIDDTGLVYAGDDVEFHFGSNYSDGTAYYYSTFLFSGSPRPGGILRNNCCDSSQKCTYAIFSRFDFPNITLPLSDDTFNPALRNILAKWEWTCAVPTWTLVYWSTGNESATFVGLTNTG